MISNKAVKVLVNGLYTVQYGRLNEAVVHTLLWSTQLQWNYIPHNLVSHLFDKRERSTGKGPNLILISDILYMNITKL